MVVIADCRSGVFDGLVTVFDLFSFCGRAVIAITEAKGGTGVDEMGIELNAVLSFPIYPLLYFIFTSAFLHLFTHSLTHLYHLYHFNAAQSGALRAREVEVEASRSRPRPRSLRQRRPTDLSSSWRTRIGRTGKDSRHLIVGMSRSSPCF